MLGMTDDADQRLTLTVLPPSDDVVELVVAGEIDALSSPELHRNVVEALRLHRPGRIDLDMSAVSFVDSAGIDCLLLCLSDARRLDCRIVMVRPQPMTRRVLSVTGLAEQFGLPWC